MARIPDADQSGLSLPGFDSGSAHRARSSLIPRPGAAQPRVARSGHPGVAELLLEVPDDGAGSLSRARFIHPADEVEKHAAPLARRTVDYPPGTRVLRLERTPGAGAASHSS